MKKISVGMLILSAVLVLWGLTMNVTVGESGIVNINLLAQRQNLLLLGCAILIGGVILFVSKQSGNSNNQVQAPSPANKTSVSNQDIDFAKFFRERIFRNRPPSTMFVKIVACAAIGVNGALIFEKMLGSTGHVDAFYGIINDSILSNPELVSLPIFFAFVLCSLRGGRSSLVKIIYWQSAICVGWTFFLIFVFDWLWSTLWMFSFEMGFCAIGVLIITCLKTKFK
jgi:hypothetical protein